MDKPRILFLCPQPHAGGPGQRFRFEQYLSLLEENGFEVRQEPFLDPATMKILYQPGHTREKVLGVLGGFRRRLALLLEARRYDYVFVHLEAAPIGPPVIEAALVALGCKIIFDIDDAIFISVTGAENRLVSRFRWRSKVAWTAKHSYKVVGVNPFLVDWARQFNDQVFLIPTTIRPEVHRPAPADFQHGPRPVIGWTGSRSTAPYLKTIESALQELEKTHEFTFRAICDRDPALGLRHYEFVPWKAATEIEDLWPIQIGVMPVPDVKFAKGKVGFKAIQYSALGIVPVVSGVGSGPEVVEHGVTGLVVENTDKAWVKALAGLLDDTDARVRMGQAARDKILATYSTTAQGPNYLGLFQ
jgi:glycosyltransferase involved in cell wall biosynthesis